MRWSAVAACLLGLAMGVAASGCFSPQVKNGGFACSMTDDPPCPNGFFCVNGLCQDHPGMSSEADLATGTGGNGGGGGGGGGTIVDMAHASPDLASTDMAQAPMCGMQADPCTNNSDCCMMLCFPGGAGSLCLF